MQLQPEVKQALKQLPLAQRVVAFALKKTYDKIKALCEQEHKEVDSIRLQYRGRYKELQEKTSSIVQGRKLQEEDLGKVDEYFVESEKPDIKKALAQPQRIRDYWLVALQNSYLKGSMGAIDQKVLSTLSNISEAMTESTIELTFEFEAGPEIPAGKFRRVMQLEGGLPVSFSGDKLSLEAPLGEGLLRILFTDTTDTDQLYRTLEVVSFLVNNIVPYSLRYFLGETDDEEEEDEEDEEDAEEEEEEEEELEAVKQKNK